MHSTKGVIDRRSKTHNLRNEHDRPNNAPSGRYPTSPPPQEPTKPKKPPEQRLHTIAARRLRAAAPQVASAPRTPDC